MTIAARAFFVLAFSLAALAAPPPMDSSFGANGVVSYPIEAIAPASLAVLSDGRILTSVQRTPYSATALSGTLPPPRASLFRFLPDGSLDTRFGAGGMIEIASQFGWLDYMPSFPIAELPGGGFVLAGRSIDGLAHQKYRDDGTADGPIVVESFEPQPECSDTRPSLLGIRVQPDGKLVVLGQMAVLSDFGGVLAQNCLAVARYLPQGGLDTAFGSQGKLVVPGFGSSQLMNEPGGKLVFGLLKGSGSNTTLNFLTLNPDGSRDTTAGAAGIRKVPVSASPGLGCVTLPQSKFAPEGIIVWYECETYSEISRFTAQGDIVASFGNGGSLKLALATDVFARRGQMFLQSDGAMVIVGSVRDNSGYPEIVVERLRPDGSADPAFGVARMFTVNYPNSDAAQGLMQPDGNLLLTSHNQKNGIVNDGYTPSNLALMRVRTAPALVEFHNSILDHYFVSLENVEARGIDNGAAGPGWQRTGQSFPSGGPAATCRFYGTRGIGPNSHFYTAEPSECEGVKRDPGWTYEGIGFYASRVVASGCPSNQVPVHRLYNNRARQNDSNHRFVVDTGLIPAMTAAGWIHEGVVFCAPR
ncbi:MAG: hypothetical protein ACXWAC_08045 [Usitatibacter sp.]